MKTLENLFKNNAQWASSMVQDDPAFFSKLLKQQTPEYLWIGCSDSRVPANEIIDLPPGGVFVHRNIANVVVHTDLNCLSVIQYSVDILKVKHIIVCGHYGCGGVKASMEQLSHGLIDNWLRHIRDVRRYHSEKLEGLGEKESFDLMCELNVIEQVKNVCQTTIVQDAWKKGAELSIHGWIYGLKDGLLKDLDVCVTSKNDIQTTFMKYDT